MLNKFLIGILSIGFVSIATVNYAKSADLPERTSNWFENSVVTNVPVEYYEERRVYRERPRYTYDRYYRRERDRQYYYNDYQDNSYYERRRYKQGHKHKGPQIYLRVY